MARSLLITFQLKKFREDFLRTRLSARKIFTKSQRFEALPNLEIFMP